MKNLYATLALSVSLLPSCATLFTGTKDTIHFETIPPGAKVQINGIDRGTTPCDIQVKRSVEAPTVVIKKEGYSNRTFELEQSFNIVAAIDLPFLLPLIVDVASGSIMKYDPKTYELELDKKPVVDTNK